MASSVASFALIILLSNVIFLAHANDPDITSDFLVPEGVMLDANFFTFTGLKQNLWGAPKDTPFKVTKASLIEFPALDGQSVSYAALQYGPGGINPPHTHPRSAELLIVLQGALNVGLVDSTKNKLFTQILQTGDNAVLHESGIDNAVLSKSFKVDSDTIQEIVSANEA